MSAGFAARPPFTIALAVDAEQAKPSDSTGRLDCNATYEANLGLRPLARDIGELTGAELLAGARIALGKDFGPGDLTVLLACAPCTDFSRTKPANHLVDSPKNSLVVHCAEFVKALRPEFFLMENARELIRGNHPHHYRELAARLRELGYSVKGGVHLLTRYGLPQIRERALVVAWRDGPARDLDDLWEGYRIPDEAVTVRTALSQSGLPPVAAGEGPGADPMHVAPGFRLRDVRDRMAAIPPDGGSWVDLADHPEADRLLIDSMKERLARGDLGSHPDVYGRLWWDRPAVTIKRECAHVGNGRYAHPVEDRLLTVREMATLQGFPTTYRFPSASLANRYRHIGDAVPPLISYQLSALVAWMKTGERPTPADWVLPGCSLRPDDIQPTSNPR